MEETSVAWDLSDLYSGLDDPRIQEDLDRLLIGAEAFETDFKGRIASEECTAETLRMALDRYDALLRGRAKPLSYANLLFNADTTDAARGAFLQRMQLASTAIGTRLLFLDLEVGKMPERTFATILTDAKLASYRHYLEHEREIAAHYLSEAEERIAEELANTGIRAFDRLFDEAISRARFRVVLDGETQDLTESEVIALLYRPERQVRVAASEAITATLKEHAHLLTFIFNNLLQHKATMDRLRGYSYPEQARHLDNEVSPTVAQHVVDVAVENFGIVADYYRLKRHLLSLEELTHYDRYAPIAAQEEDVRFEEARRMVLSAFGEFSGKMNEMADRFFTRSWIDAEIRPGKTGGAFCMSVTPDEHPYVFMNYTGKPRDVMTLAHELGHAVHGVLSADVTYLDFHPSLPMAETASVFAEMLVFDRLRQQIEDPRERLALLTGKIEDTFATVFRQVAMYRFEQQAHRQRREQGELTTEQYNAIWQSSIQEMFGDSLRLGEDHAWWWMYIPHVFSSPFYVYAYAFGELLVLSLYAQYRREGEPFVERYFNLLSAGGSRRPAEILGEIGVDIEDRAFWQGGMELIREMVTEARQLAQAVEPAAAAAAE